jgi:hypothetical protein
MKSILLCLIVPFCLLQTAKAQTTIPRSKAGFKLVFEKTYLHTDRDVYAAGDTLWFKAYLVNAQDNTPISSSGNLHVDLIAPDAGIVSSELIRLDGGLGNGDFSLPDSIPAGKYHLRAYTNWMRNFGDNFIFDKDITILNTGNTPLMVNQSTKAVNLNISNPVQVTTSATNLSPTIRFYPEGGAMVEGISSLVAVKAEDYNGKGIVLKGSVLSAAGDTVARYTCDSLGMGLFALLPLKGQVYHSVSNITHGISFNLPAPLSSGFALQIKQTDSLIRAVITHTGGTGTVACKLTVKHSGITLLNQDLQLNGQQTAIRIPSDNLPEGVAAITLYDDQNKPNCERLVYIHHPNTFNSSVTTSKKTYSPKEKVTVQIDTKSAANLSMAVVDADMAPDAANDIVSSLLLGSELKGNIEQAHRYFDTNVNRYKQLDLLLMTQGWRNFIWRRLADTAIRISYAAENGIEIPGRVRDEVSNKYMPGLNVSLYASGAKGEKLYSAVTDSTGRFNFTGLMLYGNQNVRLTSINGKGENKGSFMMDTLTPMPVTKQLFKKTPETANDSIIISAMEAHLRQGNISKKKAVTKLKEVKITANQNILLRSGGVMTTFGADQVFEITPFDYQYKTVEWFLQKSSKGAIKMLVDPNRSHGPPGELMRPITGLGYSGVDTFKMVVSTLAGNDVRYIPKNKIISPILFINGKELNMENYDQAEAYRGLYFNMPINKVKKIILRHVTGTLHGFGINPMAERIMVDRYLLFLTLTDDASGALNKDIPGYYEARTYYQPLPGAKPSLTDYRSTIYWEPNIKTDAAGNAVVNFYNITTASKIKIILQGIHTNGMPVNNTTSYSVK